MIKLKKALNYGGQLFEPGQVVGAIPVELQESLIRNENAERYMEQQPVNDKKADNEKTVQADGTQKPENKQPANDKGNEKQIPPPENKSEGTEEKAGQGIESDNKQKETKEKSPKKENENQG